MLNRRDFLKGVALATTAAGLTGIAVAAGSGRVGEQSARFVAVRDRLYRLDGSARVLVSRDGGASWSIHSNFGPRYAAERMKLDASGRLWLAVRHDGHRFGLRLSEDGVAWQTA